MTAQIWMALAAGFFLGIGFVGAILLMLGAFVPESAADPEIFE